MTFEKTNIFLRNQYIFYPVVPFDPKKDRLLSLDFTSANTTLTNDIIEDTEKFTAYIQNELRAANARYGIGGYAEHRTVYSRSGVFDADAFSEEPRRLHLGVDIWGPVGTPVYAPLGGMVKSFAFNDHFGDYGATIILLHQLEGVAFYSLYGHLSVRDIENLSEGAYIIRGQVIGHFGPPEENGHWPPHVHIQLIYELGTAYGDYPGVCKFSEKDKYMENCPDPDLMINMNRFISKT
jgi:peptidoglycan LD-endopeptidase LytH